MTPTLVYQQIVLLTFDVFILNPTQHFISPILPLMAKLCVCFCDRVQIENIIEKIDEVDYFYQVRDAKSDGETILKY